MLIKSITIENIRSIKSMHQDFPQSMMLFFGDIGSGKSSVLKAIEFALFGILDAGDLGGESLLRRGEKKGFVELTFAIDDHEYTVRRDLERSKGKGKAAKGAETVNQGKGGFLIVDGVKTPYSAKELRVQVLKILGYSVPRYQNAKMIPLYRFTVYTPQEQVKEILWEPADKRFEVLKEVFEIVKYETALTNVKAADDGLRARVDAVDRQLAGIGDPETQIPEKQAAIQAQYEVLADLHGKLAGLRQRKDELVALRDAAQADLADHGAQSNTITAKESAIAVARDKIKTNQKKLADVTAAVEKTMQDIQALPALGEESDITEADADRQIEALQDKRVAASKAVATVESKIASISTLLETGRCSLCGQEIHEKDRFDAELADAQQTLSDNQATIDQVTQELDTLTKARIAARAYTDVVKNRATLEALLTEKQNSRGVIENVITDLEAQVEADQCEIAAILEQFNITDVDAFKARGEELQRALTARKSDVTEIEADVTRLDREESAGQQAVTQLIADLATLESNVKLKAELEGKIGYIKDVRVWLNNSFPNLVRNIERELLASTAQRFNDHFREWFKLLVEEETIDVEIDPADFQPVVKVNGYESPAQDLSGGEKSALALAYRLALDKVIVEKYPDVKTRALIILDEPTDGFSSEQTNRMQAVFQRLGMAQMIIISHERTLDSFVSDIFTFTKKNHETMVKKE